MSDAVTIRVTIPSMIDLSGKVAKQIPFAVSLALNAVTFQARTGAVGALPKLFTVRNKFVAQGVNMLKSTKVNLSAAVGIESKRAFMTDHMEGGERHKGDDKLGSAIPLLARRTKTDRLTQSKFPSALLSADGKKKSRRLFFLNLAGHGRLGLMKRLSSRQKKSRGVLKRNFKDRKKGDALKPREELAAMYIFEEHIDIKEVWDVFGMVQMVVKEQWDREFHAALDKALGRVRTEPLKSFDKAASFGKETALIRWSNGVPHLK